MLEDSMKNGNDLTKAVILTKVETFFIVYAILVQTSTRRVHNFAFAMLLCSNLKRFIQSFELFGFRLHLVTVCPCSSFSLPSSKVEGATQCIE
jgi:hypothetical protein